MAEEYYVVRQKSRPEVEFEDSPLVFVSVSNGKLNQLEGDSIIFSLLTLKDGVPTKGERALLNYDIFPFKDKVQYDFHRAMYNRQTCKIVDGPNGPHSERREERRVIAAVVLH